MVRVIPSQENHFLRTFSMSLAVCLLGLMTIDIIDFFLDYERMKFTNRNTRPYV
jgi:hypothetical protein